MEFMIAWRLIREIVIVGEVFCPSYNDGVSSNDGSMNIPLYSCRFQSPLIACVDGRSILSCCYGNRFVVIDVMLLLIPLTMLLSMPVVLPLALDCSGVGVRKW